MASNRYCVIMAGGIGSRFWPKSRQSMPKQFLDILGTGKSFIRHTYERFEKIVPPENFLVVTNRKYKDLVLQHLPELTERQVLCEPVGRNTAPCIAYAAYTLLGQNPDAEMIVTPSDHLILNEDDFRAIIGECLEFADRHDALMTVGIKPTRPDTGYGYIQVSDAQPVSKVKCFTEKPDLELAQTFLQCGEFFWNSGIFVWKVKNIVAAFEKYLPEHHLLFSGVQRALGTDAEQNIVELAFAECRAISIDYGIMEKASKVLALEGDFGWSDVGSWDALESLYEKDEYGNITYGEQVHIDTHDCIIYAKNKLVTTIGLDNVIVVETEDAVLVCDKNRAQEVKKIVEALQDCNKPQYL